MKTEWTKDTAKSCRTCVHGKEGLIGEDVIIKGFIKCELDPSGCFITYPEARICNEYCKGGNNEYHRTDDQTTD